MEFEKDVYQTIRKNQLVLEGSWNSSFNGTFEDDWHYALEQLTKKKIILELLLSLDNVND